MRNQVMLLQPILTNLGRYHWFSCHGQPIFLIFSANATSLFEKGWSGCLIAKRNSCLLNWTSQKHGIDPTTCAPMSLDNSACQAFSSASQPDASAERAP